METKKAIASFYPRSFSLTYLLKISVCIKTRSNIKRQCRGYRATQRRSGFLGLYPIILRAPSLSPYNEDMGSYKKVDIVYLSHIRDVLDKLTKLVQEDTEQDPQYLAGCFSTLMGIDQLLEDLSSEHFVIDTMDAKDMDLPDA